MRAPTLIRLLLLFLLGVGAIAVVVIVYGRPIGFVYVVALPSRELLAFAIVDDSGKIEPVPGSPFPAGAGAIDVAVAPSRRQVFVSNQGDKGRGGSVSVYDAQSRRGRLGAATPVLAPDGSFAALAVDPGGRFLYAAGHLGFEHVIFGYRLDKGAGHLTPVGDLPVLARGGIAPAVVRVHPSGRFLYMVAAHGISAYEIAGTGALTEVAGSPFARRARPMSAAVAPSGRFLYAGVGSATRKDQNGLAAYAIDETTGALAEIPASPWPVAAGHAPLWLAIAPSGRFLYASNTRAATITAHAIDPASGAIAPAPVASHFTGDHPRAYPRWLTVDRSGRFLYATALTSMIVPAGGGWLLTYRLDQTTGGLTPAGALHLGEKTPAALAVAGTGQ